MHPAVHDRVARNEQGARWISSVVLHPVIAYTGTPPSADDESALHEAAHRECFIANSVRTRVTVMAAARP